MHVRAHTGIVRTPFLDSGIAFPGSGCCRRGGIRGACLDPRPFRLAWPAGSRCFELDLPAVLDFKERALAGSGSGPACERILVPADLLRDWTTPLLTAGFKPGEPTVWIAEGLLIYFTEAQNDRL